MELSEVEAMIKKGLPDAEVIVDGEGCSFSVTVVSGRFEGLTRLKKQQLVLDSLKEPLATGELHAITIKACTPGEWVRQ